MEFGPKLLNADATEASKPVRMALTPMMVPVPMITPSTVRNARSLCDRMVWKASTMPLKNACLKVIRLFFDPQRFDGVQSGSPPRGIDAKKKADGCRESYSDQYGGPGKRHGDRSQIADQYRHHPRQRHPNQPSGGRQNRGFHQVLIQNIAPPRTQGFADSDLMRSLGDYRQHDVHDDDAAHHHKDRYDPHGHGSDGRGEPLPQAHDGFRGEDR